MTKFSGFWFLFMVVGTTFMFLYYSSSSIPDMVFTSHVGSDTMKATSRKLKVIRGYNLGTDKKLVGGNVNLEDYHPIDPVPSSKASIKPGPIQHGTPLIPFIPKPSPPGHPMPGHSYNADVNNGVFFFIALQYAILTVMVISCLLNSGHLLSIPSPHHT